MQKNKTQFTWDLTAMFPNTREWHDTLQQTGPLVEQLEQRRGRLAATAQGLLDTAKLYEDFSRKLTLLFVYANCNFDQNMADAQAKELYETIVGKITEYGERLSFLTPELMELSPQAFAAYCEGLPALKLYEVFARDFFTKKPHVLAPGMEELMVRMNDLGESFQKVFSDLVVSDISFPTLTAPNGEPVTAGESGYQLALSNENRAYRAAYYNALLGTYQKHVNTISSLYYGSVKNDVFTAKSRHYESARAHSLSENHIPVQVYDNLLSTVRQNLAPLHDYLALRGRVLDIDDLHFYDLFVPLVKGSGKSYSFEEAKAMALAATAVLGEDYTALVRRAFDERWIDVYPGENKQNGGYCTSAYDSHPYILLNFTGTLDDVFTLVHELGHAMHYYFSNHTQPYLYSEYSIFCAEVASTLNEQLLSDYLLKRSESKQERAALLQKKLDDIRSTFYRQTMFADFEHETHRRVEQGRPLLPQELCALHRELNELYYGPKLTVDDALSCEWARIPHFYNAFYVYQYATGIAASTAIAKRILGGVPQAAEDYRRFLTTGCSRHPIELLRIAGVDMATPQPLLDTVETFCTTMEELKTLL